MKSSSSRSFALIMVVCGAVIGGVLLYLMWSSWNSAIKSMPRQGVGTLNQRIEPLVEQPSFQTTSSTDVDWSNPVELSKQDIKDLLLKATTNTSMVDDLLHLYRDWTMDADVKEDAWYQNPTVTEVISNMWLVGKVKDSLSVYLIKSYPTDGPAWSSYNVVAFDELSHRFQIFGLDLHGAPWNPPSNSFYALMVPSQNLDSSFEMPKELILENSKKILKSDLSPSSLGGRMGIGTWMEAKNDLMLLGKTSDGKNMYRVKGVDSGCILLVNPVGLLIAYTSEIQSNYVSSMGFSNVIIEWNNKIPESEHFYVRTNAGCGPANCTNVDKAPRLVDLEVGGKTTDGDSVYIVKDYSKDVAINSFYDNWYNPSGDKGSVNEMLKQHPIPYFYWQDALGRWIRYDNSAVVPQAECGKPVIYLYPEKKTEVSVKLPRSINVTVSDPQYPVNGWNVSASPDGILVSNGDERVYDSLYWEGTGVTYQAPKTGFVVKGSEISTFLSSTLPKYGLNSKETKDFMDFWVPKMEHVSYARISFLTDTWSNAVPLNVTPRPQTNIRIFMDWKPLSAPISLKAPTIITPARDGFTLVEWGGLLYK